MQNDVEIKVYVDNAADSKTKTAIGHKIEAISEVDTVVFSTKEKELDNLIDDLGENGEVFQPFEQDNPLRDAFVIKTKDARGCHKSR